jgi:hypothetical protein
VFAAAHSGGLQVTNSEIGLGSLKPDYWGVVKGARLRLDFSRDADPNIADMAIDFIDEEGATQTDRQLWLGGALRLPEISAPGTPASGYGVLYAKSDGLYWKDDAGDEHDLTAGGGSGDVTGPAGATTGNFASFADATGKVVADSGISDADFAAAAHSHADYLEAANNLGDVASKDASLANLISNATNRSGQLTLSDRLAMFHVTGTGGYATPQSLLNLVNSLTAETAPVYNDKVPIYDTSTGQTDAVTIASLFGAGKAVVVEYTGSGSSGKTVTLTGINRAHAIFIQRYDAASTHPWDICLPMGSTGTVYRRSTSGIGAGDYSLSAPSAGTAQVLTINDTGSHHNASGVTYRLLAIGTPT